MSHPTRHLATYLEQSADRAPSSVAVVEPDGTPTTYAELNERASRVAAFLARRGVRPGARVGILLPKSTAALTAIFGTLKADAAYVPVDPTAPVERSRTILRDCSVSALFVHESVAHIVDEWEHGTPATLVVLGTDKKKGATHTWEDVLETPPEGVDAERDVKGLAYILYTSGSTGIPKGVQISHENASSFVEWGAATFSPEASDSFSSHAPLHFDLSIFDIYVAMRQGATIHLISDALAKDPRQLARFIAERRITIWYSTPSALTLLGQHGRLERLEYAGPRTVLFAGEVFPVKHLRMMTETWSGARWFNLYGPTETNVCTFTEIPLPVPEDRVVPYPIGVVCEHCTSAVLGADGVEVARGEEGCLWIGGSAVFLGYWNRPELNARVFREISGERYYDTGDLVREDGTGQLLFCGRRDRMVKRRGYRIELGEVESGLYRHPDLREVAAVALPDDAGVRIVVGFSSGERVPTIVELKQFSSQQLPLYMVPDAFRHFNKLPSTSTGKVDYQCLTTWLSDLEPRAGA